MNKFFLSGITAIILFCFSNVFACVYKVDNRPESIDRALQMAANLSGLPGADYTNRKSENYAQSYFSKSLGLSEQMMLSLASGYKVHEIMFIKTNQRFEVFIQFRNPTISLKESGSIKSFYVSAPEATVMSIIEKEKVPGFGYNNRFVPTTCVGDGK